MKNGRFEVGELVRTAKDLETGDNSFWPEFSCFRTANATGHVISVSDAHGLSDNDSRD